MKLALILSYFVAATLAGSLKHIDFEWEEWKSQHGKLYYDAHEEAIRRDIWEKNVLFVDQHNKEAREGKHSFTVEMNKFADLHPKEFGKLFLGVSKPGAANNAVSCNTSSTFVLDRNYGALPEEIDWRTKGYVTPVKDQGQCGSCWAFSTTGSIEGAHFKKTGKLVSLSEQNLMDCSKPEGDFSCEGGLMDYAFDYVIENGGIDTEESYPYKATDEKHCEYNKKSVGATISGCVDVTPRQSEKALQKALAHNGPISVAIDASQQSFQLYAKGIYRDTMCSSTELDHGVLAVGYGSRNGNDYWIVKNSWGESWGLNGYILMSRNKDNQCGIATQASYPVA